MLYIIESYHALFVWFCACMCVCTCVSHRFGLLYLTPQVFPALIGVPFLLCPNMHRAVVHLTLSDQRPDFSPQLNYESPQ